MQDDLTPQDMTAQYRHALRHLSDELDYTLEDCDIRMMQTIQRVLHVSGHWFGRVLETCPATHQDQETLDKIVQFGHSFQTAYDHNLNKGQ